MRTTSSLVLVLVMTGCGGNKLPDPICQPDAAPWAPGTAAYSEVTEDWGLVGVEGVRLVAVDFDGDGWTDLHVHRGSLGARGSFSEDGTRRSWLLRNDEGRGFVDVTEQSGFRITRDGPPEQTRAGGVVAFGDVDNDGDMDAITAVNDVDGSAVEDTTELMINQGDGTFSLGPDDAPWRVQADAPAGVTFVDADRDGILDVWMPRNSVNGSPAQDRLYRGVGDGSFVDVTDISLLTTQSWSGVEVLNEGRAHTNAWSSNACDLNNDGWPELLAASYGRAPNHLWQNNGRGAFENRSVESGYAFDENQDYTDNQFFRCFCVANPGAADCDRADPPDISCGTVNWREPTDREPFRNGGNSAATSCRDLDNDGDLDLITGEIQHWWAGAGSDEAQILVNDGGEDVVFSRPGNAETGLTRDLPGLTWDKGDMTNAVFDFDNDGWADIYIGSSDYAGTRGLLWHQDAPLSFSPVSTDDFFEHNRSHGVAVADFDRDGDMDVVVGHSRSRCGGETDCYERPQVRMFRNELGGNYIQLDLIGDGSASNRNAVGARVEVTAGGVTQTLEVGGGYGHYGAQYDRILNVGLGSACEAEVRVRWPDAAGTTGTWTVPAGYRWRLSPGQELPEQVPLAPVAEE